MKPKKIFTVLDEIDDDMIEEADTHFNSGHKKIFSPVYRQMVVLCAALILIITGGVWFVNSPLFKDQTPVIVAPDYNIRGVIMRVWDGMVLMKATNGWVINSSDLVTVPVDADLPCKVGMNIEFYYNDVVMEIYPAQLVKPSEVTISESNLPTFGELYDFENYLFHSAREVYYVDTVENGIGHTETEEKDYYFPENSDGFHALMREILTSAKPLKNVGYHDYFFNNPTTRVAITTSADIAISMTFDIVVEEMGWLKIDDDMFFIGEENSARLIDFVRTNGTIMDELSVDEVIDYVSYNPINFDLNSTDATPVYMAEVLEKDGKILFLWCNDYQSFWVEMFDIETKETKVVWEYSYSDNLQGRYFKLESANYGEFDYRIAGWDKIFYKSTTDPLATEIFETPIDTATIDNQEYYLTYRRTSFDIYPQDGIVAYSNADGVYIQKDGNISLILDNNDLVDPDSLFSFYGSVHFLNEGKQLAATIIAPGGQFGNIGFVLTDIDTGEVTTYNDVFSAMVAAVDYIGDKTVALRAIDRFTIVNAEDKTSEVFPWDLKSTFDYQTFVDLNHNKEVNGVKISELTSFTLDNPDDKKVLFTAADINIGQYSVTENFVICLLKSKTDSHFAIINLY